MDLAPRNGPVTFSMMMVNPHSQVGWTEHPGMVL